MRAVSTDRQVAALELDPIGQASAQARAYVRRTLHVLGREQVVDTAELGVSELVANACLHARTAIRVTIRITPSDLVRIEVSDQSSRIPEQRRHGALATTGRGLRLLDTFGTWGVEQSAPPAVGKTVWFEPSAEPRLNDVWLATGLDAWEGM